MRDWSSGVVGGMPQHHSHHCIQTGISQDFGNQRACQLWHRYKLGNLVVKFIYWIMCSNGIETGILWQNFQVQTRWGKFWQPACMIGMTQAQVGKFSRQVFLCDLRVLRLAFGGKGSWFKHCVRQTLVTIVHANYDNCTVWKI